jgi:hypothetical protein
LTNISVSGNVEGSIVVGDNNFVVNNNHGTIVQQAAMPTQRRTTSPAPPRKPMGFVGRKLELGQIDEWIASCTPAIVHGLDGIGKTSLVKQAANSESARSQPDGVLYLEGTDEAGKLMEFDDIIQSLFNSLFESQPRLKVDLASARTYLSNTRPMVLLNSISLSADNLGKLLDLFPQAPILVATENLDPEENYESFLLGPITPEDSVTLLANRSKVTDQEALARIAALLDNVPAALSAVANAIFRKRLTVEEAVTRLGSYTSREKDKEKASLDRAFALIYSTLTEEEQGMLLQTAAAPGISTERTWLESVCGGSTVSEKLESMELLQANSPRLRLMPGLRYFLVQGRDLTRERERLLTHLLSELKTRWNDFDYIQSELGNLLGLLAWSAAQGQWANVAALGRAIDPYLTLRGLWKSWRRTLGQIQSAAGELKDLALQGWVLHQLGTYEIGMGNLSAARNMLEQAVSIRQKLGDEVGVAYSQHNLQMIVPALKPASRSGNLTPWLLGGLAVLAIAGFFIFRNFTNNPPPPTAAPVVVVASEVNTTVPTSFTSTSTYTPTDTLTDTPTPTVTMTATPAPSDTPNAIPTYTVLGKIVVNEVAACFHGPGTVYLNKGTRRIPGNTVDVLGRIETDKGIWVNTRFSLPRTDTSDPCWMDSKFLDITPEQLMSVQPIDPTNPKEYILPIDYLSRGRRLQDPPLKAVTRSGNQVTASWEYFDVGEGEFESDTSYRYLIEAWLCKAGKLVFTPSGWGPYGPNAVDGMTVSATLQDEPGCTEPSHARLYLAWVHGYAGPTEIQPWP